jgi:amino-acid N-acetyltransferase
VTCLEKARISDAVDMHRLINFFADRGEMLPRPLSEIYENIRDYFIIRHEGKMIACAALHVNWSDLAEVKSLAVAEDFQRQGHGLKLVQACVDEARELGLPTVFCLTYKPVFFEKLGFTRVDRMELPRKVWNECYRCPKFLNCDEIALVRHIDVTTK